MNERYTIAITRNPQAGEDMISILIIDTAVKDGNSEVYNSTVERSQKIQTLLPFLEKFGDNINIIDASV